MLYWLYVSKNSKTLKEELLLNPISGIKTVFTSCDHLPVNSGF